MTLNLQLSNLLSWTRRSAADSHSKAVKATRPGGADRPATGAETFGMRATADAWQFACNQRMFR